MITAALTLAVVGFGVALAALMWDWLMNLFNYGRRHD